MKCEHISPSRATLYEQCELRYKMRYELGLTDSASQRQDTGLFVHKALELYYSPHFQYTPEQAWAKASTGHTCTPFSEFVEAKEMYLATIQRYPREQVCTVDTEVKFDHTFDTGLHILGVIDRIDVLRADCLRLIDFKTGSRIMNMQEMRDSHQTNMYALWAFNNPAFDSFSHIIFSYMYIREGIFRDITITKEQVMQYKGYLESLAEQIISNVDPQPTLNSYCWNCPGRNTCSAYNKFMSDIMSGKDTLGTSVDDLRIDNVNTVIAKIKAGISILEREKKMLDSWMICMLEECPNQQHTTESGVRLALTSKRSVQPDVGVVMQLAKERGISDDLIDLKHGKVEDAFKDDPVALEIIRSSSTVEYGQPYVTTSKGKVAK